MSLLHFDVQVGGGREDGIPVGRYSFSLAPSDTKGEFLIGLRTIETPTRGERPSRGSLVERVAGVPPENLKLGNFGTEVFYITSMPENAPRSVRAACLVAYIPGVREVSNQPEDDLSFKVTLMGWPTSTTIGSVRTRLDGADFRVESISSGNDSDPDTFTIRLV